MNTTAVVGVLLSFLGLNIGIVSICTNFEYPKLGVTSFVLAVVGLTLVLLS